MSNAIEGTSGVVARQVASSGPPVREPYSSTEGSSRVAAGLAKVDVAPRAETGPASKNAPSVDVAANFTALQQTKEQTNQVAQSVRQLEDVRSNIDKMAENLTKIVKMYPPYPKDSSGRAQLLSDVAGMRKLIDQLTIPPSYESLVSNVLNTPALGDVNASDAQVSAALDRLNVASAAIAAESKKLFASGDTGSASRVGADLAAQQQSQSVGAGLAETGQGVSSDAGKPIAITLT